MHFYRAVARVHSQRHSVALGQDVYEEEKKKMARSTEKLLDNYPLVQATQRSAYTRSASVPTATPESTHRRTPNLDTFEELDESEMEICGLPPKDASYTETCSHLDHLSDQSHFDFDIGDWDSDNESCFER